MKKEYKLIVVAFAAILVGGIVLFFSGAKGTTTLWNISGEGKIFFPLVTIAALIDSINPCAFSVLLLTIAFLLSVGKLRSSILKIGGVYILGIFTAYILIGFGILHALHLFNTPRFMGKAGAIALMVLGIVNLINEFFPSFPIKLRIPSTFHRPMAKLMEQSSLPAAFALGALVGLCEFPCTGGPYLMVLGLLHDATTYLRGVAYLVWYNIIFILPLVIILLFASNKVILDKVEVWETGKKRAMRFWSGVIMIILGAAIFLL